MNVKEIGIKVRYKKRNQKDCLRKKGMKKETRMFINLHARDIHAWI